MKVIFDDFSLQDNDPCHDALQFYDGADEVSTLLGSYCGTKHPEVIFSTGLSLFVKFYTNAMITERGFSFRFSAVKRGTVVICSLKLFDVLKPLL